MGSKYDDWKIQELKDQKYAEQHGVCAGCHKSFRIGDKMELAHILPQRKYLLKLYGEEIIHHPLNMKLTHSGYCNSAVQISPNKPVVVGKHVDNIRIAIEEES